MKRRRDFVIIARILREALESSPRTRIMNMTNMGYRNFASYLDELLNYNLLERIEENATAKLYRTTEKGKEVLKLLSKTEKLYYRKQQQKPRTQ